MARHALAGFLVARHSPPEWELENIVVAPEVAPDRDREEAAGYSARQARQTNSEAVFLEVRESNTAARRLYEKLGFRQTGRRKSYYTNPIEDAVLYPLNLCLRRSQVETAPIFWH